ncbi:hypothetical protein [Rhodococcus sp. IEGM 1307]|uniref:hypothetical protein n=1 Tax=Rhodococcus sp. IEGM 1307 TaxID=3047091 RepID=UPI0024B72830|nr:hypothetical protein [Rhodococcus sp. IEGM 1307]MDI9979394.1 hypothetical protein [Rhodococcus sp. IEGM 1307]
MRPARRPYNNPAARWTFCTLCHHRGYHSRADAKAVRKRHPGEKGLAVFVCPHTTGLFHIGHRPDALSNGQIDRQRLRNQAARTAGDRRG